MAVITRLAQERVVLVFVRNCIQGVPLVAELPKTKLAQLARTILVLLMLLVQLATTFNIRLLGWGLVRVVSKVKCYGSQVTASLG